MTKLVRPIKQAEFYARVQPIEKAIVGGHIDAFHSVREQLVQFPGYDPGCVAYMRQNQVLRFVKARLAEREQELGIRWITDGNLRLLLLGDRIAVRFNKLNGWLPCFNATDRGKAAWKTGTISMTPLLFEDADDIPPSMLPDIDQLVWIGARWADDDKQEPRVFGVSIVRGKVRWRQPLVVASAVACVADGKLPAAATVRSTKPKSEDMKTYDRNA